MPRFRGLRRLCIASNREDRIVYLHAPMLLHLAMARRQGNGVAPLQLAKERGGMRGRGALASSDGSPSGQRRAPLQLSLEGTQGNGGSPLQLSLEYAPF